MFINISTCMQQAYRKISLFLLPAQAPAHRLEEFCRKFEIVSKVHYILSDASKRQVYDEKGVIDASVDKLGALFGTKYWKKLFPHIVPEDIEDFKEIYKDSEEEKEDLQTVYLRAKGDMDRLAEVYFAYSAEDEDRICDIMLKLIKRKIMPSYAKFMKEAAASIEARKKKVSFSDLKQRNIGAN
ncbi:unnamed protein product [Larinioides sclopetarius]|uniref:DNAJC9 HTH domain-containing protein n=1 Tax=Larinioides sclopetarius TaxID=280406 RepID=A0AAV2AEB5_9ARAC